MNRYEIEFLELERRISIFQSRLVPALKESQTRVKNIDRKKMESQAMIREKVIAIQNQYKTQLSNLEAKNRSLNQEASEFRKLDYEKKMRIDELDRTVKEKDKNIQELTISNNNFRDTIKAFVRDVETMMFCKISQGNYHNGWRKL